MSYGGYKGATSQGHDIFKLFSGMTVTGIIVGGLVALLILWTVLRYRRRSDEMPKQFQYHFLIEVIYTVVPVIIVGFLFAFTVLTENNVDAVSSNPDVKVTVTAFQWGWSFDYPQYGIDITGETTQAPQMVLPVGKTVQITLVSKDVIHGFYIPAFNFSKYAQPGVTNVFDFTVQHAGTYRGQCSQFCGLYHTLMYFSVRTVPSAQFTTWVNSTQNTAAAAAPSTTQEKVPA